jgi:hypothetical protein
LELSSNQVGYVPAAVNVAPVRLPSIPDFLKSTPGIRNSNSNSPDAGTSTGNNPATAEATTEATGTAASVITVLPNTALIAPSPTGVFNPANAVSAPVGTAIAGGGIGSNGPTNGAGTIGDASSNLSVMLDSSGAPLIVTGDKFSYNRNGALATMTGGASVGAEKVYWGVYDGGTMVDNGITTTNAKFFWMDSSSASTSANLVTALSAASMTFSNVGGFTSPVTEGSLMGGRVTASTLTLANVSTVPSITAYSLSVTDALGRNWGGTLIGTQSLSAFQTGGVNNLSVSCTGACASTGTGNVQGVPIGNPTPGGMISSYKMTAGSAAVVGAVLTR